MIESPQLPSKSRILPVVFWLCIAVATLFVSLYAYVQISGARHWAQMKDELKREGETLDFDELLERPIPEATNFGAIKALAGIELEGDDKTPQGRARQALDDLGWRKKASQVPDNPGSRRAAHKIDLAVWAKFARDKEFIQMPPDSGNPGRDLLEAMDRSQPLVKDLADAAATRPFATFTPTLKGRPLPEPLITFYSPAWNPASSAVRALGLRALAANGCDEGAAATASVQAMLRLADAESKIPHLISLLTTLNGLNFAQEAVWSILNDRTANEEQLLALQTALEKFRLDQRTLACLRGEFVLNLGTIVFMQKRAGDAKALAPLAGPGGSASIKTLTLLSRIMPAGLYDENKVALAEMAWQRGIRLLKNGDVTGWLHENFELQKGLHGDRRLPSFLATMMAPAATGVAVRVCESETVRRQAVIACALERYHLQHEVYPAELKELMPQFISSVPLDWMDGRPMRYRRTPDDRYRLWSVAIDQKDDEGKVNVDMSSASPFKDLSQAGYKGDWSWQYEPLK